MALQGNLEDFSLAEILQLIALQRKSGVLKLTSDEANAVLFFEKGNIVSVTDRREKRNDPLMDFLVSTQRLTPEQIEQVFTIRAQSKKDPLEIIITGGYLTSKQLSDCIEQHTRELLPKLLAWKKGDYFFSGDEKTVARLFLKVPMRTEALLIESMRRLDEGARIRQLYSPSLILRSKGTAEKTELVEEEKWVLSLMDGRRPIREILAKSRMGEFDTYQIISDLIDAGLAEVAEWHAEPVEKPAEEPVAKTRSLVPAFGIAFVVILMSFASLGLRWTVTRIEAPSREVTGIQQTENPRELDLRFALEVYRATYGSYPDELRELVEEGFVRTEGVRGFRYVTIGSSYDLEKE